MKIKGAIFDMDGTLVDSMMFWEILWKKVGLQYRNDPSFRPPIEVEKATRTMIYREGMAYVNRVCGLTAEDAEFVAFAEAGVTDFYRTVAHPKEGAIALLQALRAKGISVYLASATAMSEIRLALDCYGMTDLFDGILSCVDIGVGKDRPDIYRLAMDQMGMSAEEVCVFEDSFVAMETAKKIGCHTVGIFDPYNLGQDRLRAASEVYVEEGQRLDGLAEIIETMET
ncbi:MAG: HAD family phosphatase [Clostridia bacterium]|nr:HAD family phosphatase [Clostridia bacterium]